jgi:predicted Fe-Mo cluster-binding NifX family protein
MKIAVSAYGQDLDSQLDSRFGRCSYFMVVNPDEMSFKAFKNESSVLGGGAGIQSAQFIASKGVDAVITGNCGPNAVQTLTAAGVELFVGQAGTVREVVERFKTGKLSPTTEATVDSHFGMAPADDPGTGGPADAGRGMGRGTGGGRGAGRGMGGGRCMGRGMGRGGGMGGRRAGGAGAGLSGQSNTNKTGASSVSKNSELETLKEKADNLNQQLKGLMTRINQIETRG